MRGASGSGTEPRSRPSSPPATAARPRDGALEAAAGTPRIRPPSHRGATGCDPTALLVGAPAPPRHPAGRAIPARWARADRPTGLGAQQHRFPSQRTTRRFVYAHPRLRIASYTRHHGLGYPVSKRPNVGRAGRWPVSTAPGFAGTPLKAYSWADGGAEMDDGERGGAAAAEASRAGAAVAPGRERRMTAGRERDAVLRVLRGEPLEIVAREPAVTAASTGSGASRARASTAAAVRRSCRPRRGASRDLWARWTTPAS